MLHILCARRFSFVLEYYFFVFFSDFSKITAYSQCVKIKLTDPTNTVDALLAQYVDADNFGNAFSEYCANKERMYFVELEGLMVATKPMQLLQCI